MFECCRCGKKSLIWNCDYDTEDFGMDEKGIVSFFHCTNEDCNSEIQVTTLFEKDTE